MNKHKYGPQDRATQNKLGKKTGAKAGQNSPTSRNKEEAQPITPTGYHGTDDERKLNPEE